MPASPSHIKIRSIALVFAGSILLMAGKFVAFWLTHSNAILTDALESIVNVVATGFALFSLYFAAQPRDRSHPYGHGKIEFFSAGVEGGLIFIAGLTAIGKAIYNIFYPTPLEDLNLGIWITAGAGALNFLMGYFLIRRGKKYHSVALKADGQHLLSDTYSSIGLVAGLLIIHFTQFYWLDNLFAIIFGGIILVMGYRLVRQSVAGLLDKADQQTLQKMLNILEEHRKDRWIDIHRLRVQKYGSQLHVDCHITFPWYDNLKDVHEEVEAIETLVDSNMEREVEFFIHADPCVPTSCPICQIKDCPVRQAPHKTTIPWTLETAVIGERHQLKHENKK